MGYRTRIRLEPRIISKCPESQKEVTRFIEWADEADDLLAYAYFDYADVGHFDWESGMEKLSRKYKNVVFTLTGEGEDDWDRWKLDALNGTLNKRQGQLTYEPRAKEWVEENTI